MSGLEWLKFMPQGDDDDKARYAIISGVLRIHVLGEWYTPVDGSVVMRLLDGVMSFVHEDPVTMEERVLVVMEPDGLEFAVDVVDDDAAESD